MSDSRKKVLDWAERGLIQPENLPRALKLVHAAPTAAEWRQFLDRLLLWSSVLLAAAGVICFFAANWDRLGRFGKLGLMQAILGVALIVLWRTDLERRSGRAALLAASLAVGALVALVGQIYQLGADDTGTFLWWAALILPWVLLSRFPALWLLWLAILHAAIWVYEGPALAIDTFSDPYPRLWAMFLLDAGALVVWEAASRRGLEWLRVRWATRLLAFAGGLSAHWLASAFVAGFDPDSFLRWPGLVLWFAWLGAIYWFYRRVSFDGFILAGALLSVILLFSSWLLNLQREAFSNQWAALLVMGLLVIALTAVGARWLQRAIEEAGA